MQIIAHQRTAVEPSEAGSGQRNRGNIRSEKRSPSKSFHSVSRVESGLWIYFFSGQSLGGAESASVVDVGYCKPGNATIILTAHTYTYSVFYQYHLLMPHTFSIVAAVPSPPVFLITSLSAVDRGPSRQSAAVPSVQ